MRRIRVMLDSNVWRYLYDSGIGSGVLRKFAALGFDIFVPICNGEEACLIADEEVRNGIFSLMISRSHKFGEWMAPIIAKEISTEFNRCFPNTFDVSKTDEWLAEWTEFHHYRKRINTSKTRIANFWDLCVIEPKRAYESVDIERLDESREMAREARQAIMDYGISSEPELNADGWTVKGIKLSDPKRTAQAWRVMCFTSLNNTFLRNDSTVKRILRIFLNGKIINKSDWENFWFELADPINLNRTWLMYAVDMYQRHRKVTNGTPQDLQFCLSLLDADVFLTADKSLYNIIDNVTKHYPGGKLSTPILVKNEIDGILDVMIKQKQKMRHASQ